MEIKKTGLAYNISDNKVNLKLSTELNLSSVSADSLQGDSVAFKTEKVVRNSPFADVVKSIRKGNFNYSDFNRDGKIPLNEYLNGGDPSDPKNQNSVKEFNEVDANHNNEISPEEAMNSKIFGDIETEKDFEPILNLYFEYNDQNQDKKVSKEEFLQANGVVDEKDKQAFYTMFRLADKNNDGLLSKSDFKKYIYANFATGLDMDKKICSIN